MGWLNAYKQTIRDVVMSPEQDGLSLIDAAVSAKVPKPEQTNVKALLVEELRRLHEGVLARYGLRPSEFTAWKKRQEAG